MTLLLFPLRSIFSIYYLEILLIISKNTMDLTPDNDRSGTPEGDIVIVLAPIALSYRQIKAR